MPLSPLEMERFDEWNQAMDVNIKSVLWGIAAALPHFKAQRSGQFINVSSVAGHTISPGGAIYSATKYSVRVISEALRKEVKPYNIRTTVISPARHHPRRCSSSPAIVVASIRSGIWSDGLACSRPTPMPASAHSTRPIARRAR